MSAPAPRTTSEEIVVTKPQLVPWIAVLGVIISGVAGLYGAFLALGHAAHAGARAEPLLYVGAGACLLPPAVGFGLLTNAIFRR
jgi:hypothetical protein